MSIIIISTCNISSKTKAFVYRANRKLNKSQKIVYTHTHNRDSEKTKPNKTKWGGGRRRKEKHKTKSMAKSQMRMDFWCVRRSVGRSVRYVFLYLYLLSFFYCALACKLICCFFIDDIIIIIIVLFFWYSITSQTC